jgi:Alpha/beta hydrolase domain
MPVSVTRVEIRSRRPFAEGRAFGEVGAYERLDGTIHFAVDPTLAANRAIVDLERAARDAGGRVTFSADLCLLRPADPSRGNDRLLFDVLNRGRKVAVRSLNRAPVDPVPTEAIDPGDGFLMRRGWTIAWCGWQWDVVRSPALLGLEAPTALDESDQPIAGQVLVEFQPNRASHDALLANRVHRPYSAADPEQPDAQLLVRDWWAGPRATIPRDRWRFARDDGGRPVPDADHVWLADGFVPGRIYEVVYRTRVCPVVGSGLLAVRDCVSFLRYADAAAGNPCADHVAHAYGFGVSQSGRFLRHFLYLGLNLDEAGRPVFDGVLPHVAGARRGEFNHRFAQPSVQSTAGFGHLMPFGFDDQTDPLGGRTDGLLRRQRELGGVPRIVATNTSAEYWRGDCSLLHTDLAGQADVEPPAGVRVYHFAGTQHGTGVVPLVDVEPNEGTRGAHPFNMVDYSPLLRAALVNLDRWVTEGVEPPPSAFPRLGDGSAVRPAVVIDAFRDLPNVRPPTPERVPGMRRLDLGPRAAAGVGRYPPAAGEPYPTFVAAVDADRNELAGVRLPDLTVPLATVTGWNTRHPETGGAGQLIPMAGSTLPFAATAEERRRTGDPRPAIAERYRDRDDYLARVRRAAEELVARRYVLPEDVETLVELAGVRCDTFAAASPHPGPVPEGEGVTIRA